MRPARDNRKNAPKTRYPAVIPVTRDPLAALRLEGDYPLDDERLCVCGCLEADHRALTESCSRCRRCPSFAAQPEWDVTLAQAVPTEDELLAELERTNARRAALEAELVAAAGGRR